MPGPPWMEAAEPPKQPKQEEDPSALATAGNETQKEPVVEVTSWGTEEVLSWAKSINLDTDVQTKMKAEQVTGKLLLLLNDEAWKVLGVRDSLQTAKIRLSLQEQQEAEHVVAVSRPKPKGILLRIPIVNLWVDFVGAEAPTMDNLRTSLDTLGLLGALFITVAMALPASVEYEEIEAAIARLDGPPYNGVIGSGEELTKNFALTAALSIFGLGSSLICTVVMLVTMALTRDDIHGNLELRGRWWSCARWLVLWDIGALIIGIVACFFSFNRMVFLKLPDFLVEKTGNWEWFNNDSTYALYRGGAAINLGVTLAFAFVNMSYAKFRTSGIC